MVLSFDCFLFLKWLLEGQSEVDGLFVSEIVVETGGCGLFHIDFFVLLNIKSDIQVF